MGTTKFTRLKVLVDMVADRVTDVFEVNLHSFPFMGTCPGQRLSQLGTRSLNVYTILMMYILVYVALKNICSMLINLILFRIVPKKGENYGKYLLLWPTGFDDSKTVQTHYLGNFLV